MKRYAAVLVFFSLLLPRLLAQLDHISIAAGTDEDKDLQTIAAENDAQKKIDLYQNFVQKYSANPAAVAYGDWQLSQAYQAAGDLTKALDYGDKALAGSPHNLDILVAQAQLAQQAKNDNKMMDYAARGGAVCSSIGKNKPAGMSDEDFAHQSDNDKQASQSSCDFLETIGINVIADEKSPKARMADIEQYSTAFPNSKFNDQVSSYAMYTLGPGQLNDPTRLVAYGQKILEANPNSVMALLLLANFYADDAKPDSPAKAVSYAQKAIAAANPDAADADNARKLSAGVAHSTLGYVEMKQGKLVGAVNDLKTAVALLKDRDQQQLAVALYRLGIAYNKSGRNIDAQAALQQAVKIPGPAQAPSQDLLLKVNANVAKGMR